jgi:hypothetical protein
VIASAPHPCDPLPSAILRGSLDGGLLVCLGLLRRAPERFEAAAVAWHARWCEALPGVGIDESRAALAALKAFEGSDPSSGALALRAHCERHGLDKLTAVIDAWLSRECPAARTA